MKISLTSVAAITGLALASAAQAQTTIDPQWYVRGDVGATYQDEINSSPKVKDKSGWTVDAAVGRQIDSHFRVEGELLYSDDKAKIGGGRVKVLSGLANGFYDFDTGTKLKPFVGAGLGIGQVKLEGGLVHDSDTGFAYQLQTGVAYPINDRLSAQVGYRYLGVNDVKIGSRTDAVRGDYHDQAVTVGLTYKLQEKPSGSRALARCSALPQAGCRVACHWNHRQAASGA
jgi:opacity protein-like surface antigen